MVDGQLDCSIMSTPGGVVEDLWAECSGYRTPPSSGLLLLLVVVPADGRSAGEVVAQSDAFAMDGETVGVICPAIDIGDTFLTGCWSPC